MWTLHIRSMVYRFVLLTKGGNTLFIISPTCNPITRRYSIQSRIPLGFCVVMEGHSQRFNPLKDQTIYMLFIERLVVKMALLLRRFYPEK